MLNSLFSEKLLGDVLTLQRGFDLPSKARLTGSVPIVSSSGITGTHNKSKVEPPGIVTGRYGTIGEVFFITEPFWPLNTTLFVKDFKGNDPKFLSYLLKILNISELNSAGAVPGINRNHLHQIKTKVPPLPTQQKIAHILSAYDDLIENNLKRIKLLEEMAQITYEQWFVRLKFPGHETTAIDAETGLPEGWVKGSIGDLVGFLSGYAFKSTDFSDYGCPIIKIKNINDSTVDINNTNFVSVKVAEKAKSYALSCGDLLIAMTGATVGKVGILPFSSKRCYLNQRVGKFTSKNIDNIGYVFCLLSHDMGYQQVLNFAAGAAQPNISGNQILSIKIDVPPEKILNDFSKKVKQIISTLLNLRQQNQYLKETRNILLPRLMTGMIDVDHIEIPITQQETEAA